MCLIVFSYQPSSEHPLILLAHRDEFTARPTAALHWWQDQPDILGGRDLTAQGSWLAIHKNGRIAAITNVRQGGLTRAPKSRGEWITRHLLSTESAMVRASECTNQPAYGGFNALFGTWNKQHFTLAYGSNRFSPHPITAGVHGLSNGPLNGPWPKTENAKVILGDLVKSGSAPSVRWLEALRDTTVAPDQLLPDTGIGIEKERWLSPLMIAGHGYGTRSASFVCVHYSGRLQFAELTLDPARNGQIIARNTFDVPACERQEEK